MKREILSIVVVFVLVILFLAGLKIQGMQVDSLRADLQAAKKDAAGWKETAETKGRAATAQAELASACIKREDQAQADLDNIADIMATAEPQPITPEQAKQGVDDATRIRAVDMLNRPW